MSRGFVCTFDGQHICLDEPFPLTLNAKLTVTVLPDPEESQDECEAWLRLSEQKLERAYGDDEPDYSGFLRRTPTMQEGDVLLTPIPQADGQVKTVPPFFSEKCLLIKVY